MSGVPRKESNTLKALEPPYGENQGGISVGKNTFLIGEKDTWSIVGIAILFLITD